MGLGLQAFFAVFPIVLAGILLVGPDFRIFFKQTP